MEKAELNHDFSKHIDMSLTRRDVTKYIASCAGISLFNFTKTTTPRYHQAKYWHLKDDKVECELCPHRCLLVNGKTGLCRNRKNQSGVMVTLGYSYPCAVHIDPIEKKPLYHMYPGARTFSVGIAGCNLRCKNCQNFEISQSSPLETGNIYLPPESVIEQAIQNDCQVIAFTYSEPSVWYEYVYDTARLSRKAGLKTVLVSSGFINPEPFIELAPYIDGAHIDLKSYDEKIYRNLNAGDLDTVLLTIETARGKGVWIEIVNLVIPQWTDNQDMIRKMCKWIYEKLGKDTPLHFSRFFPIYQLANLYPTPASILEKARKIAVEEKLRYVYIGNMPGADSNTYCPNCRELLIGRNGYLLTRYFLKGGACGKCGTEIAGIWKS